MKSCASSRKRRMPILSSAENAGDTIQTKSIAQRYVPAGLLQKRSMINWKSNPGRLKEKNIFYKIDGKGIKEITFLILPCMPETDKYDLKELFNM